jgi:predicted RNA-binding protein YlxR (DUF448 family)
MQEGTDRHIPMRMCSVTREKLPKKELIRLVRTEDGVQIDMTGKLKGRGLNLKPDVSVFDEGMKRKVLERGLKASLSQEQKDILRTEFEKAVKEKSGAKQVVRISSEQLGKLTGR